MSSFSPVELEAYVRQRAPDIARDIRAVADKSRNEADLVSEMEKILEKFAKNFDVQLRLEKERTLINGRADAVYNRFVIEYEPPRSLTKLNSHRNNRHALEQVQQYIEGLERLDRHKKERMAGVALDGGFFIFARYRDEHWHIDDPVPVDSSSTETFLRYLLSLSTELALTPENLVRDFGENSKIARQVVPVLYKAITTTDNKKAKILFQQWERQFREVSGYDPESSQLNSSELGRLYAVKDKQPELENLFFAIHTYYATFIKLLALQVAYFYLMPRVGTGLAVAANYDTERLRSYLIEMENGGLFAQLGIRNFLEGDFFGWYLDIWNDALDVALRRLVGDLANYSLVTLDVDPEETRDLLKQLYQNLMPKKLRHALGEYYTPDWLAERLLNQLGYDGNPAKRLLDPACGSGTFPVLALKRARKYAEDKMLPPAQVLEQLLSNIVGFDLNPLAVISARTNYLLALGDLLPHRKTDISIPIYLADSILTPTQGTDLFTQSAYSFSTAVGRFSIPKSLVKTNYIDRFADLLEESVHAGLNDEQFQKRLMKLFPLTKPDDEPEINLAVALYRQLLELEQQGVNGIWARIIKNAFAPLFQERFDYIAGNPPWINWESLPQDYRSETSDLWHYYRMAATKGKRSTQFELGKQKRDISTLMTYVAADKYLRDKGRLGFIITQTVFKANGAEGFRRFQLPDNIPLKVITVDDMANLKPFEGANNRTSIFVLEKGQPSSYPVKYSFWYKPRGGKIIPEDQSLEEIVRDKIVSYRQYIAQPVDSSNITSPWISGRPNALKAIQKILGESDYQAKAGVGTWLNGVYWVEIVNRQPDGLVVVSNITEGTRNAVSTIQAHLETDLLYPLLRGRDINRWQAEPTAFIILPHTPETSWQAIPEQDLLKNFPKTYEYFHYYREPLLNRPGYRLMRQGHPFYIVVDVHVDTFAPYKVVWPWISQSLTAAVVTRDETGKIIIPEHNSSLAAFDNEREAHYFCACFNSSPANFAAVSSYSGGGGGIASPTVVKRIRVPRYNPSNEVHVSLSTLSQQAHLVAKVGNTARVGKIETEIDGLVAYMWGLTEDELREIQESLEELR